MPNNEKSGSSEIDEKKVLDSLKQIKELSKKITSQATQLASEKEAYAILEEKLAAKEKELAEREENVENESKKYLYNRMKEAEKIERIIKEKDDRYDSLKKEYELLLTDYNKNEKYAKELEQKTAFFKEEYEKLKENPDALKNFHKEKEIMSLKERIEKYESLDLHSDNKYKHIAIALGTCLLLNWGYIILSPKKHDSNQSKAVISEYKPAVAESSSSFKIAESSCPAKILISTPAASNYAAEKSTFAKIRTDADIVREIEALKALPKTDSRAMEISRLRAEREELKKVKIKGKK